MDNGRDWRINITLYAVVVAGLAATTLWIILG